MIKQVKNPVLHMLLMHLLFLLNQRQSEHFITHIHSHQFQRGLSIGNNIADKLVAPACQQHGINLFEQA